MKRKPTIIIFCTVFIIASTIVAIIATNAQNGEYNYEPRPRHYTSVRVSIEQETCYASEVAAQLSALHEEEILPTDIVIHVEYFSWLDFVSTEQFAIVRDYLGIPPGGFNDDLILQYAMGWDYMTIPEIQYYDGIPINDMPYNPRRILVKMFEGWTIHKFWGIYDLTGCNEFFINTPHLQFGRVMDLGEHPTVRGWVYNVDSVIGE